MRVETGALVGFMAGLVLTVVFLTNGSAGHESDEIGSSLSWDDPEAPAQVLRASEPVVQQHHVSNGTSEVPTNILDILSRTSALLHAPEAYETHGLENNRPCYNATLQLTVIQSHETPVGIKVGTVKVVINETLNKMTYTMQQTETIVDSQTAFEDAQQDAASKCKTTHTEPNRPRHCGDIQDALGPNAISGAYQIYPYPLGLDIYNKNGIGVFCDLETDGGGWTVIQRRMDTTDFERKWDDYRTGFGDVEGSHWLGLDTISQLTQHGEFNLRIDMKDWEGVERTATYRYFRVAGVDEKYKLYIYDYVGNAGTAMEDGQKFSTIDQDNDADSGRHCAKVFKGAWWYKACHLGNLNGLYLNGSHTSYADGVNWKPFRGYHYSLKRVEMKIRTRGFKRYQ